MHAHDSLASFSPHLLWILVLSLFCSLSGCALLPVEPTSGPPACPPTEGNPVLEVTKDKRSFQVTYDEPSKETNGEALDTFSHTTVYLDIDGRVYEYTKRDGTQKQGGGTVGAGSSPPLNVTIPEQLVPAGQHQLVRLCVTATNAVGEGPPSH